MYALMCILFACTRMVDSVFVFMLVIVIVCSVDTLFVVLWEHVFTCILSLVTRDVAL